MPKTELLTKNKQKTKTSNSIFDLASQEQDREMVVQHMYLYQRDPVQEQMQKTEQTSKSKSKSKSKKGFGIFNKGKSKKINGYEQERKEEFRQQLLTASEEHLKGKHNADFIELINKIREFAQMEPTEENAEECGEKLMEARRKIQEYIASKESASDVAEAGEVKIAKMYEMWFASFSGGNLKVPDNAEAPLELENWEKEEMNPKDIYDMSNQPLFAGEPNITELKESSFPEKTFLASVVMSNPMAIKNAMRDNGKTVTVRFYERPDGAFGTGDARPCYITVNKTVQKWERLNKENLLYGKGLWVEILAKAYRLFQLSHEYYEFNFALTGKTREFEDYEVSLRDVIDADYKEFAESNFNDMQDALKKGSLVTAVTRTGGNIKKGLEQNKGYVVVEVYEKKNKKKFVKLKDPMVGGALRYIRTVGPNGQDTFQRENMKNNAAAGVFELEFNEFISSMKRTDIYKGNKSFD